MQIAMISAEEKALPEYCTGYLRDAGVDVAYRKCGDSPDALLDFAEDAEALWMQGYNPAVNAGTLAKLPKVKVLYRSGSGVDSLPLDYAAKHGIAVCATPETISESVAEHTVSLLCALARHIVQFDAQVRRGEWDSSTRQTKWHLSGRTLGVVGYGRIGRRVAELVAGFRMKVLHFDPFSRESTPLDELLKRSDFVTLNCPLTPDTAKLINARTLKLMKPDALIVNTSRGGVVDNDALFDALEHGTLGGAALDVIDPEPPGTDHPLLHCAKVIVTPHVAAFSADFERNFWTGAAKKVAAIADYLNGRTERIV